MTRSMILHHRTMLVNTYNFYEFYFFSTLTFDQYHLLVANFFIQISIFQ